MALDGTLSGSGLVAMFPGPPVLLFLVPLIGIALCIGVVVLVTKLVNAIIRRWRPGAATRWRGLGPALGLAVLIGAYVWERDFDSPLPLPRGATDVQIQNEVLGWGYNENLRFRISPAEFRTWMESLCHMTWAEIEAGYSGVDCGRPHGNSFGSAAPAWMELNGLMHGYWITARVGGLFSGSIVYDSDQQVVLYHYSD